MDSATSGPEGDALARELVLRGLATPDQIESAVRAVLAARAEGREATLSGVLKERGVRWDETVTRIPSGAPVVGELAEGFQALAVPDDSGPLGRPFGRYRLVQELGRGGMGVVWKAWDRDLKRIVALKLLREADDPALVERFLREARLAARLRHPAIVSVLDVGTHADQPYLTTEFIHGTSLDKVELPMPPREAAALVRTIGDALSFAHRSGVIHRDVKPANILIEKGGRPYLVDFGLAKRITAEGGEVFGLTVSGQLLGTPLYMSPEQASGRLSEVGPASDQFSLGSVLYELVTGRPPFDARGLQELLNEVTSADPLPPGKLARVPADLETICLKCLEKGPSRRYPSVARLVEDLGKFLEGEPIDAKPASVVSRLSKQIRRHRATSASVAAAVAVALLVGGLAARSRWKQTREFEDRLAVERREREEREARSREVVRKVGLVQGVLTRWAAFAPSLAEVERLMWTTPNGRGAADAIWPRFQAFLDETPSDPTSRATALALAGWARWSAGHADEGIAWMRQAASVDPDLPYGRLLEALTLLWAYIVVQQYPAVVVTPFGEEFSPVPPESDGMRAMREQMERLAAEAAKAVVWGEGLATDLRVVIDAVRASQEGRYEDAERGLTAAIGSAGMQAFHSDVLLARARARYFGRMYQDAGDDVEQLLAARPGEPNLLGLAAAVESALASEEDLSGRDGLDGHRRALALLDAALARVPWSGGLRLRRSAVLLQIADLLADRGKDPRDELKGAIEDLRVATAAAPEDPDPRGNLASAWLKMGEAEDARGIDPVPSFERSLADAQATVRLSPDAANYNALGNSRMALARAVSSAGGDGRDGLRLAIEAFVEALERRPGHAPTLSNRGNAWSALAHEAETRGEDPIPLLEKALADHGAAISARPDFSTALINRGSVWADLGDALADQGKDPREALERALADFDAAARLGADGGILHQDRGGLYLSLGDDAKRRGEPPDSYRRKAEEECDLAIRRNASLRGAWIWRGDARRALGRHAEAIEDYGHALATDPDDAPLHESRARSREAIGDYKGAASDYDAAAEGLEDRPELPMIACWMRAAGASADPSWALRGVEGFRAYWDGRYGRSLELYGESVRTAPPGAADDAASRTSLMYAWYDIACTSALLSVGTHERGKAASPPEEEEARSLRERAFEALSLSFDLGWRDREHVETDEDLLPLHADPRWQAILDRLPR